MRCVLGLLWFLIGLLIYYHLKTYLNKTAITYDMVECPVGFQVNEHEANHLHSRWCKLRLCLENWYKKLLHWLCSYSRCRSFYFSPLSQSFGLFNEIRRVPVQRLFVNVFRTWCFNLREICEKLLSELFFFYFF